MRMERFHDALIELFDEAEEAGVKELAVTALDLHKRAYPGTSSPHSMPMACNAMRAAQRDVDVLRSTTPSGRSTTITILYRIPWRKRA